MSLQLGQKVTITAKYIRRQTYFGDNRVAKFWYKVDLKPREGIYIGRRTLTNGTRVWDGGSEMYIYSPEEYVHAILVVFSDLHRPVLVPMDSFSEVS